MDKTDPPASPYFSHGHALRRRSLAPGQEPGRAAMQRIVSVPATPPGAKERRPSGLHTVGALPRRCGLDDALHRQRPGS